MPSPSELRFTGPDWVLCGHAADGRFPAYRDILPPSASRFVVERGAFLETLRAVARATTAEDRGIRLDLSRRSVRLSAGSSETSRASVRCTFAGGGDDAIHTAFAAAFLDDAFASLDDERVVIDVAQNVLGGDGGTVTGQPAMFSADGDARVRWLVMPVNLGLPADRASLGSNYRDEAAA